jgi:hypothetical protein
MGRLMIRVGPSAASHTRTQKIKGPLRLVSTTERHAIARPKSIDLVALLTHATTSHTPTTQAAAALLLLPLRPTKQMRAATRPKALALVLVLQSLLLLALVQGFLLPSPGACRALDRPCSSRQAQRAASSLVPTM